MKPILISSGEPAGIGPDICLDLVNSQYPIVIMADPKLLLERAQLLGKTLSIREYIPGESLLPQSNSLTVMPISGLSSLEPQRLSTDNVSYIINMLTQGVDACLANEFSALVTAPVNKEVINAAGINFHGHTEFIAEKCKVKTVVMMLASEIMKVALVTTHLPLRVVPDYINISLIQDVIRCVYKSLQQDFTIQVPRILVAGLNPHAGEGGYLGKEEIEIISPAIKLLKQDGINIEGPLAADTMFSQENLKTTDTFIAMYHDQGLSVIKYASFGNAVNITLGLPIIRTSVDHGTALSIAGTGKAKSTSLIAAVDMAVKMVNSRISSNPICDR